VRFARFRAMVLFHADGPPVDVLAAKLPQQKAVKNVWSCKRITERMTSSPGCCSLREVHLTSLALASRFSLTGSTRSTPTGCLYTCLTQAVRG
jgi:hypothetical protein